MNSKALSLTRTKIHDAYDRHTRSMKASFALYEEAAPKIKVPTLILQGKLDPVFPVDHGQALHQAIKGSELRILDNAGHAISPRIADTLVAEIDNFLKKHPV